MKKIILISVCWISYLPNAYSSCWGLDRGYTSECYPSAIVTDGSYASCGEGCTYTYDKGTLTVVADNEHYENPEIYSRFFGKAYRENNTFSDENGNPINIENVIIDGFTKIPGDAFLQSGMNISGKNGTLVLDKIDWNAFSLDTLSGNIIWRGTSVGGFNNSVTLNGNLIIEDSATVEGSQGIFYLGSEGKVFCKTDLNKCQALLQSAGATDELIAAAESFPEGCETLNLSGSCAKCKNENFKLNDGECDRLRWTPAEAAKVLHDDNTNEVTITFKK